MVNIVYDILVSFYRQYSQHLDPMLVLAKTKESCLIEVHGPAGSGKSYLFKALTDLLTARNLGYTVYRPHKFCFNQFEQILQLVADVEDDEYQALLKQSLEYNFSNKYDFYYFITEQLRLQNKLGGKLLLIDDIENIDAYSRDFLQYLLQYAHDLNIKLVAFTQNPSFMFAQRFEQNLLTPDDITRLLTMAYPDEESDWERESEIIFSLTEGNVAVVESLLNSFVGKNKLRTLDFTPFLETKLTGINALKFRLGDLSGNERDLLTGIYLLDGLADIGAASVYYKNDDLKEVLDRFETNGYLRVDNNKYRVRRQSIYQAYFDNLVVKERSRLLNRTLEWLEENPVGLMKAAYYMFLRGRYEQDVFDNLEQRLELLKDNLSLRTVYEFIIEQDVKPEQEVELLIKIGKINRLLNESEAASDCFRKAMQVSSRNKMPVAEIVYLLAESLFANNSPSFALEIIKKFSGADSTPQQLVNISLLKAEILIDQENFKEALAEINGCFDLIADMNDNDVQKETQAKAYKVFGKYYYAQDQWEQSEQEFNMAEKLYVKIDDPEGLAAIYNNIGVLAILQGQWDKAEALYRKSLELEHSRFNLNGISVSHNNLGYLTEEKGDYKKSLEYFTQALQIQKFLANRYNITNIYANIGVTYMDNGEYPQAADALEKSLQTAIDFNLYRNVIASLNNLGGLYFKWGDWNKAVEYYERAIAKSEEHHFLEGLLRSYNNLGELYENKAEFSVAYDLYFKGLEFFNKVHDEYLKNELRGNLGSVLTNLHKFADAYPYLIESYDFFKNLHAKDKIAEGALKLGTYFTRKRNYESASYYIKQSIETATEINDQVQVGKAYLVQAELDERDLDLAEQSLKKSIDLFTQHDENFELAIANNRYAAILFEKKQWEKALDLLDANKRVIRQFGAINLLEKTDLLISKISKDYEIEIAQNRNQENLLNKFYEITNQLNEITSFDLLVDTTLDSVIRLSEADGGILCLYPQRSQALNWEYKLFKGLSQEEHDAELLLEITRKTLTESQGHNFQQPHFAPLYNNITTFPLSIRNNIIGVLLLFSKSGSYYFTDKMRNLVNALCNQVVMIIENIRHTSLAKSHASIREELSSAGTYTNIIGKSTRMQDIFTVIDKIKDTPTSILLEGESGTGKELIARAIHYTSNRQNKAFMAQYCGALPETLLESELFGHVKGSFTGAAYDKKGLLEIADGGTFFLDEIADISLSTQAKLLRFLQEGEVKRVGSTKTQKVNVRVVCATNVSLSERVKEGKFRLDLYYRLNVIRIDVPPLRERKSDIPLLAIHFLDQYCSRIGKQVQGITDEAMKYLMNCDWPGNIRQLENEIERAVTLAENESFIRPADLSEEVFKYAQQSQTIELLDKVPLKQAVEDLERRIIRKALEENNWNQTQAALDLGLSRQGLIKKMKRYDLDK